jgi:hypothetical protein
LICDRIVVTFLSTGTAVPPLRRLRVRPTCHARICAKIAVCNNTLVYHNKFLANPQRHAFRLSRLRTDLPDASVPHFVTMLLSNASRAIGLSRSHTIAAARQSLLPSSRLSRQSQTSSACRRVACAAVLPDVSPVWRPAAVPVAVHAATIPSSPQPARNPMAAPCTTPMACRPLAGQKSAPCTRPELHMFTVTVDGQQESAWRSWFRAERLHANNLRGVVVSTRLDVRVSAV